MKALFSVEARSDLREITAYLIAHASQATARRVSRGLRAACNDVAQLPKGNVVVARHRGNLLHRRPWKRWVILYQELGGRVVIVRIADGAQDYLSWFEG